jgi:DNA-binding winged helix-turn-helix (wHTH) protein/tetratricopeptide (TPR) repeat protein
MQSTCPVPTAGRYLVGDIAIDTRQRRILRPDGDVEMTQRIFDLLIALVSDPDILHTREALLERVWGTTCIEDSNLTQSISVIRKALGETRKDWIRTVSKKGYSFEPPDAVRFVTDAARTSVEPTASTPADLAPTGTTTADVSRPPPPSMRVRPWLSRAAAALVVAVMLGLPGAHAPSLRSATAATPAPTGIGIVLVATEAADASDTERWATRLLKEWLRWKLEHLPSVTLIDEADLIADHATSTYFIDLRVQALPRQDGDFAFTVGVRPVFPAHADTHGVGDISAFERTRRLAGGEARLPAMVDQVSNDTLAAIFPMRARDRWPALALDARVARRYTQAIDAMQRRDGAAATALLQEVVRAAPDFGPARLHLAQDLAHDGDLRRATEQAQLAFARTRPLPPDAAAVLAAETAAVSPQRVEEAGQAYARLHAANPARVDFLLARARLSMRASQHENAVQLLSGPGWDRQPLGMRIRFLQTRAEANFILGYLDEARRDTTETIALLGRASGDRRRELGAAQMMIARIENSQTRTHQRPELYAEAASTYEAIGYTHGAMVARFHEAMTRGDIADAERRLEPLLVLLRENGNRGAEIRTLRAIAEKYHGLGMVRKSMAMRTRAFELASLAGDVATRELLDLDLLDENLIDGDLAQAARRVERLRENKLWTKYRFRVARREHELLSLQGRHREALSALDRKLSSIERGARPDVSPTEAAKLACARMDSLLSLGELNMARAQSQGCHDRGSGSVPILSAIGLAGIELHSGNVADARAHADRAALLLSQRKQDMGKVGLGIAVAGMLTRLREYDRAERLYREVSAAARQSGYRRLQAEVETGLAELAAARRDWVAYAAHRDAVRRLFPQDVWHFGSRLELLEVARLRAVGQVDAAQSRAVALAARAERLGDALVRAQAMAMRHDAAAADDADGRLARSSAIDWLVVRERRLADAPIPLSSHAVAHDVVAPHR